MKRLVLLLMILSLLFVVGCAQNSQEVDLPEESAVEESATDDADAAQEEATDLNEAEQNLDVVEDETSEPVEEELEPEESEQEVVENTPTRRVVSVSTAEEEKEEPNKVEFHIVADEKKYDPQTIEVNKGDVVKITFEFNDDDIYFGGLDIKSDYFKLKYKKGDAEKTQIVTFVAEESFSYIGYWPQTSAKKAIGKVVVN